MFIRKKTKKIKGKEYTQHQLIESIRTASGPRQQIVLNLGHLDLPEDKWKELANGIEGFLTNQQSIFEPDPEIEAKARHYANQIRQGRLARSDKNTEVIKAETKEEVRYEQVNINTLVTNNSKTVGAEHVVVSQMNEYGFDKILRDNNFTEDQITYAKLLIIGRMVHPGSERETARWLKETSGAMELLEGRVKVYDSALHRTAVKLWENHESIEQALSKRAKELFSLKETVILYDLTNSYFEGRKVGSKVAKYGRSKEKRNDCPLLTLSITIDEDGFPKQSKIWEGNVSEAETLDKILSGLKEDNDLLSGEKTLVMDAGIATEENISKIKKAEYKYVVVSRKESYGETFWEESEDEKITLSDKKTTLSMKLVRTNEEVFLQCHSEAKEAKEKAILLRRQERFEKEILTIKEGLKSPKKLKKYDKVLERIGRLKERYKVGNLYTIEVKQKGDKAEEIQYYKNKQCHIKETEVGTYVLRTNRLDLCGEEISKIHRSLTTIEESFKSMKSDLGLRPNFHHTDIPTKAHAHVTVLSYHMLAGILKKLKGEGIHYSWNTIRNILVSHVRVTTTMNTKDDHVIDIRTCTTPTEEQSTIYNKLHIKHTPLKRRHVKTSIKAQRCSAEN